MSSMEYFLNLARRALDPVVVARYETNASQSIPNVSPTIINFEDQVYDTHNAVTIGAAWKFTAPKTGYYAIHARIMFAVSGAWALSEQANIFLNKNGGQISNLNRSTHWDTSAVTNTMSVVGSDIVQLAAGDYIDLQAFHTAGVAVALYSIAQYNFVGIYQIK